MLAETNDDQGGMGQQADWRLSVSVLMVGGILLVLMGQVIYGAVFASHRWRVYALIGLGVGAFVLAGHLTTRRRLPTALTALGDRFGPLLGISTGQILLLAFAPLFGLMAALAAGDQALALNLPVSVGAWLVALGCVLAGAYRPSRAIPGDLDRRDLLLIAGLFLGAFLLRAVAIGQLPATLSGDEGSAGLAAVQFIEGKTNNIFTVSWFSFPSLYFLLQSLGIRVLGQTVAGLRIVSAVGGALTVVGLYWLARSLFGRTIAVLAAVYLAASHYHIHFSRIGLNNIWDGFFTVGVLAGIWDGWKNGRRSGFLICGLALGLAQYFYVSVRVLPLLLLIWAGAAFVFDRAAFRKRLPDLVLAAFVAFITVLPLLYFFVNHPNEFNAPLQRVTIFDGWLEATMAAEGRAAWQVIGQQVVDTALGFTHLPIKHWYNPGSPLLLPGAAALFLLGLFWALATLNLRHLLVLLPLAAMIILGGISQDAPASQRYVISTPTVAILIALPLGQLISWLRSMWPRFRLLIYAAVVILMAWVVFNDLHYYFYEAYDNYVLGGYNTEVATEIAYYLADQDPAPAVFFFGFPRMGYFSLSTIPYLAPEVEAQDILDPLTAPPSWELTRRTLFVFLPEREGEFAFVQRAYPDGTYRVFRDGDDRPLFMTYEVQGPRKS